MHVQIASQAHAVDCLGTGWILVYMYEAFVCLHTFPANRGKASCSEADPFSGK